MFEFRRTTTLLATLLLALTACTNESADVAAFPADEGDPTVAINGSLVADVTITDVQRNEFDHWNVTFTVDQVLWAADELAAAGSTSAFDAPEPGDVRVAVYVPTDAPPTGEFLAVLEGQTPYGVDSAADSQLIGLLTRDADPAGVDPDGFERTIEDVLAMRGDVPRRDALVAIVAERDRIEKLSLTGDLPPAAGILGQWRLANGWQDVLPGLDPSDLAGTVDGITGDVGSTALAEYVAQPWQERQLSPILQDLPEGLEAELDITLGWHEVIGPADLLRERGVTWVGLAFDGVGVLGPFALDPDSGRVSAFGFGPVAGPVTFVGWMADEPKPGEATELLELDGWDRTDPDPLTAWFGEDASGALTAEFVTPFEAEQRAGEVDGQ